MYYILPGTLISEIKNNISNKQPICITTLSDGKTKRIYFFKNDKQLYTRLIDEYSKEALEDTEMLVIPM
jgi:hypothetical protein